MYLLQNMVLVHELGDNDYGESKAFLHLDSLDSQLLDLIESKLIKLLIEFWIKILKPIWLVINTNSWSYPWFKTDNI